MTGSRTSAAMAHPGSLRNELLGVGVYLLFGALLVGSTLLLFLWLSNGL